LSRRQNRRRDHTKNTGQELQKDLANDSRHLTLSTKEYMHDSSTRARTSGDHDHIEAIVAADERYLIGRRRHILREQQEQHKERGEYVHTEHHLCGRLGWQPKQHCRQT
jgi:hypothetical protein